MSTGGETAPQIMKITRIPKSLTLTNFTVGDGDVWDCEDNNNEDKSFASDPFSMPTYLSGADKETLLCAIVERLLTMSPGGFLGIACKVCIMEGAWMHPRKVVFPLKIN